MAATETKERFDIRAMVNVRWVEPGRRSESDSDRPRLQKVMPSCDRRCRRTAFSTGRRRKSAEVRQAGAASASSSRSADRPGDSRPWSLDSHAAQLSVAGPGPAPGGGRLNRSGGVDGDRAERVVGGGGPFGTRPAMEPKMRALHLHGAQRHLHHRSPEDDACAARRPAGDRYRGPPGRKVVRCTKRQARGAADPRGRAQRMLPYHERWLGGMLTNFKTVRSSVRRLLDIEAMSTDGPDERLAKKEVSRLEKSRMRLNNVSGIKYMDTRPVLGLHRRHQARADRGQRANRIGVPIVGGGRRTAIRTRSAFRSGNDDALRAIELYASSSATPS